MYGGYGIGEPVRPVVATPAAQVGRHERANRDDADSGIAVSIDESHAVREPGIVDHDATLGRIARQQDEVLVTAEAYLRHHRPSSVELRLDDAQVGTQPSRERHASVRVEVDRVPDDLVVVRITTVRRHPGVE